MVNFNDKLPAGEKATVDGGNVSEGDEESEDESYNAEDEHESDDGEFEDDDEDEEDDHQDEDMPRPKNGENQKHKRAAKNIQVSGKCFLYFDFVTPNWCHLVILQL